ncbi:MAG: DUF4190 domain-containing protein [Actinobacteria bacterium]|nr:DUF4190 domain-containing protein [Actinomycetota bacterium]MBU4489672.1 DUF4190 domain-containing protein [Actinomycetota bacterium]MCG2794851.1 DUF4190 domain-containing protein [Actinomycetes bacterium]
MNCPKCSVPVPEGAKFCPGCGAAVAPPLAASDGQAQPPPPGPGAVPPPPGPPLPPLIPTPPGAYPGVPVARNNPLCVASLAIGVASIVFLCGPFFGVPLAVAGIICGVMGMRQVDESPREFTGRGLGQAGLVLSIAGGCLSILLHVVWWGRVWWWCGNGLCP